MSGKKFFVKNERSPLRSPTRVSSKSPYVPEDIRRMGNKEGSIIFSMDLRNPFLSQERELSLSNTTLKTEIIGYLPTGEKVLLEFIGTNKAIGASALVT